MDATNMPAMAGPMMRAPLNMEEFKAIAFSRSSLPTMSIRNAWRAGMSNAFTTPRPAAIAIICQTWMRPDSVSSASTVARTMEAICVPMTTRRRLLRSATMPPIGAMMNTGIWLAKPTVPSSNAEPVMRYTSQDWATVCIQVPISEMAWPAKNSWKLRCRKARTASPSRDCRDAGRANSCFSCCIGEFELLMYYVMGFGQDYLTRGDVSFSERYRTNLTEILDLFTR